jgi:hypothetical protein
VAAFAARFAEEEATHVAELERWIQYATEKFGPSREVR